MTTVRPAVPTSPIPTRARRFDRSVGRRALGAGADGSSALVVDRASGREYEFRSLSRASDTPGRMREIGESLRRYALVEHPLVRAILDEQLDGAKPWVLLDFPGPQTLHDRIVKGPIPYAEVIAFAERLSHALGALHRVGLHVASVSPSNIAVGRDGLPRIDGSGIRTRAPSRSPIDRACFAPELVHEPPDARSDVFALGMILLAMRTGRVGSRDDLGRIEKPLAKLVTEMIDVDRDVRPSAAEVCLALRRSLADRETDAGSMDLATTLDASIVDTDPQHRVAVGVGATLGRFRLLRRLGEGGMGEVFQALDMTTAELVAVKVLRAELAGDATVMARFRKEARTLADVRNPFVANLLEVNEDAGLRYLVLEFVEGPSLVKVRSERGKFEEREALAIVADVCRALASAHRVGIVHRDVKPDNVMFVTDEAVTFSPGEGLPRVKLCDFGIARRTSREGTVQLTQEGAIVGTPLYMAPEQCRGGDQVSPATDVYALGVTLFELLAGRPPFDAPEPIAVLVRHLNEPPPELASVATNVSDATSALVARALAKEPRDRFADAGELLDAIERLLVGAPLDIAMHPQLPPCDPENVLTFSTSWELRASPEALWPYVSNTDRIYRASGRAANVFERRGATEGGVGLFGATSVGGIAQRWREYPYEWVEGRRWGALTVFDEGATLWMAFELEMVRSASGGTTLRYTVRAVPRSWLMRLVVRLEIGVRQPRALRKVFERIDALVSGALPRSPAVDAFEAPSSLSRSGARRLERALGAMLADSIPADVVGVIGSFVRSAPPQAIARIRPIEFARTHRLSEEKTVEGFLRGARRGLFTLLWDVLCPLCRIPTEIVTSLASLEDHAHCPACDAAFDVDFARSIEMIFRVAPEIRASELRTYCVGGPAHSPHVATQIRLAPGERFVVALALEAGSHRIRSPQLPDTLDFRVTDDAATQRLDVVFGHGWASRARSTLRAGSQSFVLTNAFERELVVRIERLAPRDDAFTAARASSLALFRELFPDEVLAPGRLVSVASVTLLVTGLANAEEATAALGDSALCERMLRRMRSISEEVERRGGVVVKTIGYGAVAAFDRASPAVEAAFAIEAATRNEPIASEPAVRVAVHQGSMVAATLGDRLDYFGREALVAAALPNAVREGAIVLGESVAELEEVEAMVEASHEFVERTVLVPIAGPAAWARVLVRENGGGSQTRFVNEGRIITGAAGRSVT